MGHEAQNPIFFYQALVFFQIHLKRTSLL